jgi:hypothetical protein
MVRNAINLYFYPNFQSMIRKGWWLCLTGLLVLLFGAGNLFAQKSIPSSYCLHPLEKQLADSINRMRERQGKKALPLSVSLSFVARTHVEDLMQNHPDTGICNLSSWSNKGRWKACCYNAYVPQHDGMWKKPQELTKYPYRGYELAAYMQDSMNIDTVLRYWKESPEAMNMILTNGLWKKKSWACMGVGINRHYLSVWFGQRADNQGRPKICHTGGKNQKPEKQTTDRHGYYLIYGSFPQMSYASRALRQIKAKGFKNAGILRSHRYIRVYLYHSSDFEKVKNARRKWEKKYPKIWILQN